MANKHEVLVIGGGVAGLQASLDLAKIGLNVNLVEREPRLGGHTALLYKIWPTFQTPDEVLKPMIKNIKKNPNIKAFLGSEIESIEETAGTFKVKILKKEEAQLSVDAIIVATGFKPYVATRKGQYRYGVYKNVITGMEFERLCNPNGPSKGEIVRIDNKEKPKSVVYILCVGSREEHNHGYCCRVGCLNALKHTYLLKERYGDEVDAYICYTDIRTVGKGAEEFYREVRQSGISMIHGEPSEIRELPDGTLTMDVYDQATSKLLSITAGLAVLEVELEPQTELHEKLGISLDEERFFKQADSKLMTNETPVEGIFLAGTVQQPMTVCESLAHASAAAMKTYISVKAKK